MTALVLGLYISLVIASTATIVTLSCKFLYRQYRERQYKKKRKNIKIVK